MKWRSIGDQLRRLHAWHLKVVFKETTWTFPLRAGFDGLDAALRRDVRRVARWRFKVTFDWVHGYVPYGYWDDSDVYLRVRLRPAGLLEYFFSTARVFHFEGQIDQTHGSPCLTGSYGASGLSRAFVMLLIYFPFVYVPLIIPLVVHTGVQNLMHGDYQAFTVDTLIGLVSLIFVWLWWVGGYLMARQMVKWCSRERQFIHDLLSRAASSDPAMHAK